MNYKNIVYTKYLKILLSKERVNCVCYKEEMFDNPPEKIKG